MRTQVMFLWLGLVCGLPAMVAAAPQLQSMERYTRIQIPISQGSGFQLQSSSSGVSTITLDRVRPGSLNALESLADARVQSVSVRAIGLDRAEIQVKFKNAATESFAYRQGNTLVLDAWPSASAAATEQPAGKKSTSRQPASTRKASAVKVTALRAKAGAEAETERAKVEPLSLETDLFQQFTLPIPELRVDGASGGFDLPPKAEIDGLWKFSSGDAKTKEGQAFELAKQLYQDKKYGLAVKTVEIGLRDHPKGSHAEEMRLLLALSYRKLAEATRVDSLAQKAEGMLEELGVRVDERGQPLPFRRAIRLYLAQKEFNRGNWLQAISHLEYVLTASEEKLADLPYVQIMLAEAYAKVSQPRRAERIYRFITEQFPRHVLAKEARYRIADLLIQEKNYGRTIEEGLGALATYPEYEKQRSEVLFQMGEASFWLGRYADAERYFRRFLKTSSANTNAALAWVRIGEMAELTKGDLNKARQAYRQAKNGYPFSPGDLVATVRLARIELPTEKEPDFIVKTLNELLDGNIEKELRHMAELTLIEYLLATGEVEKAIEVSRRGMAQSEGVAYEGYQREYIRSIFAKFAELNAAKKYAAALALYEQERKWLDLHGPATLRALANTYTGLGLYDTANEMMAKYAKASVKGRGLASSGEKRSLNTARARNSFAQGDYTAALEGLSPEGGAESLAMRAIAAYRLGRKREAYASAEKALTATEEAEGSLDSESLEELAEIVIDRQLAERDFPGMARDVARLRKARVAAKLEESERLAYAAGDALWYQKRHEPAVAAYREALAKFPKGERALRAQYNLGMSLVSLGKSEEAVKQLTELRDSGQGIWADSARQELELMAWEKKYSSVLRRLPPSGLGVVN